MDTHATPACPGDYGSIVLVQNVLVVAALFCVWLTALRLYGRRAIAWLAAALVLASTKLMFFSNELLTEILILFLFALLLLAMVSVIQTHRRRWWAIGGTVLALLTLTRPEYLYLSYAFGAAAIAFVVVRGWRRCGVHFVLAGICFGVILGPWLVRNHHYFGSAAVTGGYSDVIIAYRAAYNRMSMNEWAAAFVYWLPGHGESLAAALLPANSYARLGTTPDSYLYKDGTAIFDAGLAAVGGERARLTGYLIETEILAHPIKHVITSVPLAWRGILAGKYLAVAGLPCLLFLLVSAACRRQWRFALLAVPALAMVSLYAAVSVSIPRYNVYLIYYYAIAVAWVLVSVTERRCVRERRGEPRVP
jgi:4-amino-4-deoxy-L-arabinose transferase-like glycosyltransferase